MTAEESARFARVLGEAFDLGERMSAHDGDGQVRKQACQALSEARMTMDWLGYNLPTPADARADVAHALVALLALAGQLGLDDTLTDVDAIVRERSDELDRRLA